MGVGGSGVEGTDCTAGGRVAISRTVPVLPLELGPETGLAIVLVLAPPGEVGPRVSRRTTLTRIPMLGEYAGKNGIRLVR